MSKARNLADLLDSNGDVLIDNLDNVDALPDQTGQSGNYLTTNGTAASWGAVATPTLSSLGIDNHDSGGFLKNSIDQFCQAVTGSIINLRELYTTNKLVGYRSISFIALTTVEIPPLSPALLNRMLILKMDELPEFESDASLCNAIKEARPRLWGGLLHQLNNDVQAISADDYRVKFRMADWANFGLKVSAHEGKKEFFNDILDDLRCAQANELLESSELPALFEHLIEESRKGVSTAELHSLLLSISRREGLAYSIKSPRSLANHLGKVFPGLQKVYSISRERGRNGWVYSW